ncbi:hypothetical protein BC835DRAFT_1421006 [Cytidiella melzeri]|nr:hypothetical protein BC835DRAFT_1421006 [Cytidiella melzeri]
MPAKQKAAAQKAGSDSDHRTDSPATTASKSDHSELLKQLKKLENENKTLQRAQTRGKQQRAATSTTKQPDNAAGDNEDGENSNGLNCGSGNDDWPPEDKDNDIIGYESQFQSKGVISVVQPLKQLKCRVNNPKPTPPLFLHNRSESLSPPPSPLTVALSCTTLSSALIVALLQSLAAALRLAWSLAAVLNVLTSIISTYLKSSIFSPEVRRRPQAQSSVSTGASGCHHVRPSPNKHAGRQRKQPRTASDVAPQAYSSVEYKGGSAPTNGRPQESNYTGITTTSISRAIVRYQLKVLTETAFPDHDTQHTWARSVFQISCEEVERSYSPDDEAVRGIYSVIIGRASSFRGHLRDKICGKIVETYGLKTDTSKDATAKANAERVAWLLQPIKQAQDANWYCYEEFTLNPPRGLAQVSIIQHALQELVFCGDTSPGAKFSALFDPLPLPTIALLLAMVRFGLISWATGQLEQKGPEFRETTYAAPRHHHKDLP